MIGALGGHLGLWIGMSLLSFFEVFELIVQLFKWCVRKAQNNKTNSMTDLGEYEKREQTPVHGFKSDKDEPRQHTPVHNFKDQSWVKD